MDREASVSRKTRETEIQVELRLDGTGTSEIHTGMSFFDHLLEALARHGLFDLVVRAKGDLEVDQHHTVEDVGLTLGQALPARLGFRWPTPWRRSIWTSRTGPS
jgi:imidazoleglycerol-phosphate dehydratase